jgi:hypothetical protein
MRADVARAMLGTLHATTCRHLRASILEERSASSCQRGSQSKAAARQPLAFACPPFYARGMGILSLSLFVAFTVAAAQPPGEPPVEPNSDRVSISGCLRGRNLVALDPALREGEPINVGIEPGRIFRVTGPKTLMKDLARHDKSAVTVTGLVRKSALDPSLQGMPIGASGRIRIGGGPPVSTDPTRGPGRDPVANVPVLDMESFRPIDAVCPVKR